MDSMLCYDWKGFSISILGLFPCNFGLWIFFMLCYEWIFKLHLFTLLIDIKFESMVKQTSKVLFLALFFFLELIWFQLDFRVLLDVDIWFGLDDLSEILKPTFVIFVSCLSCWPYYRMTMKVYLFVDLFYTSTGVCLWWNWIAWWVCCWWWDV